ncbi:MAG: hypothetical protein R3D31_13445 [Hyphomicrobiaceae bacterium]
MGTATVLGYEMASRAKMVRAGALVVAFAIIILGGAVAAFTGPEVYRHYMFEQAVGRVTAIREMCYYQIKRLSKRGPAQVTGLVDCRTAYREAARIDHALGEVKHISIVSVDYRIRSGIEISSAFDVPSEAAMDLAVGRAVRINYDPRQPDRVHRRAGNPFALTHEARFRGAPSATLDERRQSPPAAPPGVAPAVPSSQLPPEPTAVPAVRPESAPMAAPERNRRRSETPEIIRTISWYIAWGVIAGMAYAIFWILRFIWRLVRRGLGRATPAEPVPPRQSAARSPAVAARIATATRAARARPQNR